jgi:hypothetical protein
LQVSTIEVGIQSLVILMVKMVFLNLAFYTKVAFEQKIKSELGGINEIVSANGPICFCFELEPTNRLYALSGSNIPHQLQHIPTSHHLHHFHHLLLLLSMFSKYLMPTIHEHMT